MNMKKDLKTHFGFEDFRPGQEKALKELMDSRRLLCIQPTGHGKSLLYQLPSLWMDGLTLVISPLLALMRDQIRQLNERFQIPAAAINSDQTDEENELARNGATSGRIRILFVAPEKLDNLETYGFITGLNVSFVVVDEAHCISTWGHDFRPSYRKIVDAVRFFENANPELLVLGLTATADRRTEEDIARQLTSTGGVPLKVLRLPMDRPNLHLSAIPAKGQAEKLAILKKLVSGLEGSGILYCATRESTEMVAQYLSACGLDTVSYHAGYDPEKKRSLQLDFMRGNRKAIAATNALGMGIDKPDIRFIVHVEVPGSITAYYQEVGRAGRDGLPAKGFLLFDESDRRIQDHFIRSACPSIDDFRQIYGAVRRDENGRWPSLAMVKIRSGLHPTRVAIILAELTEQGLLEKALVDRKQVYTRTKKRTTPDLTRYTNQNEVRKRELESMLAYGRGETGCLMKTLRKALGDKNAEDCGRCSNCVPDSTTIRPGPADIENAERWLSKREVPIAATKIPRMSAGFALLNGDLRAPAFVRFMKRRAFGPDGSGEEKLDPEIEAMLARALLPFQKSARFGAVIVVPSRTWAQREYTAKFVADTLRIPLFSDLLEWRELPPARQGELLNNDQRRDNVAGKMRVKGPMPEMSDRALLLLDDYVGSGATLKESVRTIRKLGEFDGDIVPAAIARVKWRLGAKGMI